MRYINTPSDIVQFFGQVFFLAEPLVDSIIALTSIPTGNPPAIISNYGFTMPRSSFSYSTHQNSQFTSGGYRQLLNTQPLTRGEIYDITNRFNTDVAQQERKHGEGVGEGADPSPNSGLGAGSPSNNYSSSMVVWENSPPAQFPASSYINNIPSQPSRIEYVYDVRCYPPVMRPHYRRHPTYPRSALGDI